MPAESCCSVCVLACMHIVYMNVTRGSEKDVSCYLGKLNSGLYCASRLRAGTWASGSQLVNREETGRQQCILEGQEAW